MANSDFKLKGGVPTITKDPNATLDYTLDLSAWLSEIVDTLDSVVTVNVIGVTVESTTIVSGNKIVAWISGGIVNSPASVTFRFTTVGGRTDDRTLAFTMKER